MPLQATSGAASYDAFGGGVAVVPTFIEDIFSCFLYTGNGSTQTITNGIDLSTKGGLVWCKARSVGNHGRLFDTARGVQKAIYSSLTSGEATESTALTAFNADGFTLGSNDNINGSGATNVSWTFREQPKFFDIVTYTGNGSSQTINHNLGSVPGVMIVKSTTYIDNWAVYHRSLGATKYIELNNTNAASTSIGSRWDAEPTSTSFSVGYNGSVNASGETYVAYLFAHNAGGFGLTGTDNVISCGSFTTDGSGNATVSLGYEPQWIVIKKSSDTGDWDILDTMRGWVVGGVDANLKPNTSAAESAGFDRLNPTATGFVSAAGALSASQPYIYIAIRRGPMKVPTTGTSVFSPITAAADPSNVSVGFPTDLFLANKRDAGSGKYALSRLTGGPQYLTVTSSAAEATYAGTKFDLQNNFTSAVFYGSTSTISYMFGRAPSFFDEVCYTGTGVARTVTHNLAAVPELMIVKQRSAESNQEWWVYSAATGNTKYMYLPSSSPAAVFSGLWNNTTPTASVLTVGDYAGANGSGSTYVAYLFATCAGVSKVGSYTGTAATLQIDCGFTAGARFVLIKRTDSTGDWYVWDSARGIVAGNDPYLLLNSTAAEVTNTDYVDTYSAGFEISSTAPAAINSSASGATYIFLAIA